MISKLHVHVRVCSFKEYAVWIAICIEQDTNVPEYWTQLYNFLMKYDTEQLTNLE